MGRGVSVITLESRVLRIFTKCASLLVARHHVDDFYSPPPHLPQQIEPHAIDIYGLIMAPGANHTLTVRWTHTLTVTPVGSEVTLTRVHRNSSTGACAANDVQLATLARSLEQKAALAMF